MHLSPCLSRKVKGLCLIVAAALKSINSLIIFPFKGNYFTLHVQTSNISRATGVATFTGSISDFNFIKNQFKDWSIIIPVNTDLSYN